MWTYIDTKDATQAIERALQYGRRDKDAFFITNDNIVMRSPTTELFEQFYPKAERRKRFTDEVVLSNDKAGRILGF